MKIWIFLRPNLAKLVVMVIAILLTLLVVTRLETTSKVTWNEHRGAPLPFLTLVKYQGPCPPLNFCEEVYIQAFHPIELLLDILGWYAVACLLFFGYRKLQRLRQSDPYVNDEC
jgi:hypothetical protein